MDDLAVRVARHIGAAGIDEAGRMACPRCAGDFGPTMALPELAVFEDGYLPGVPLLRGVCFGCEYASAPASREPDGDEPGAALAPAGTRCRRG